MKKLFNCCVIAILTLASLWGQEVSPFDNVFYKKHRIGVGKTLSINTDQVILLILVQDTTAIGGERVANLISSKKFGDYFKWRYSVTNVDFELDSIQFEQRVNGFLSSAQLPITPELAQSNDSKDPLARAGSSLIVAGLMPLVSGLVSATSSDPETTAALLITSGVISTISIIRAGIMLQRVSKSNKEKSSERNVSGISVKFFKFHLTDTIVISDSFVNNPG
jgi:hypothetical protein